MNERGKQSASILRFLAILVSIAFFGSLIYSIMMSSASTFQVNPLSSSSLSTTKVNCDPSSIPSSSGSLKTTCIATVTGNQPEGTIIWNSTSVSGSFSETNFVFMGAVDNYDPVTTTSTLATMNRGGLQWVRTEVDTLAGGTESELQSFVADRQSSNISVLGLFNLTPETFCGSGSLQSESNYKSSIQTVVSNFPNIHLWEYGNEVISPCPSVGSGWGNISPGNYFQGLVWFDECLKGDGCSLSGHSTDNIMGPALTMYSASNGTVWDGYGNCSTADSCGNWNGQNYDAAAWFYSFWHESTSDQFGNFTPSSVLEIVSVHLYTDLASSHTTDGSVFFSSILASGPFRGKSLGTMLLAGLDLYNQVSNKDIVLTEFGSYTGPSNSLRTSSFVSQFLNDAMPYLDNSSYLKGLFYYELVSDNSGSNNGLWNYSSPPSPLPDWYTWSSYLINNVNSSTKTSLTCTLRGGQCSVTYFDTNTGNPTIRASYQGDANNQMSSGTFQLTVTGASSSSTSSSSTSSFATSSQTSSVQVTTQSSSMSSITALHTTTSSASTSGLGVSDSSRENTRSTAFQTSQNSGWRFLAPNQKMDSAITYASSTCLLVFGIDLVIIVVGVRRFDNRSAPSWRW